MSLPVLVEEQKKKRRTGVSPCKPHLFYAMWAAPLVFIIITSHLLPRLPQCDIEPGTGLVQTNSMSKMLDRRVGSQRQFSGDEESHTRDRIPV
jgi:hypothetical protein